MLISVNELLQSSRKSGPRGFRASTVKPFNGGNGKTIPLISFLGGT